MLLFISNSELLVRPDRPRPFGKREAKILLIFVVLLFAADRIVGWACEQQLLSSGIRYSQLYKERIDADILVLGNSRGVNAFYIPEMDKVTSLRGFNLSYNGLSAPVAEALFADYLERNRSPKLLILEITNVWAKNELLKSLRLYSGHSIRLQGMLQENYPKIARTQLVIKSFTFNDEMFYRALLFVGKQHDQDWINRFNRLEIDADYVKTFKISREWLADLWNIPPSENIAAIRRMALIAQSYGTKVTFIINPFLPEYIIRSDKAKFLVWKRFMEEALGDISFVRDYSMALSDPSNFFDLTHLNQKGIKNLISLLLEDGVLPISGKARNDSVRP